MERSRINRASHQHAPPSLKPQQPAPETQDLQENPQAGDMLQMQQQYGNAAVQRMLNNGQLQHVRQGKSVIQRDPAPSSSGGSWFGLPSWLGGGQPEEQKPAPNPKLDNFINKNYTENDYRFFLNYFPTGGRPHDMRPVEGLAFAELRLHVTFDDFDTIKDEEPYKDMAWTPAQQAEFQWQAAEKATFKQNLRTSIQDTWSDQHILSANEPGLEDVSTKLFVNVKIEPDEALAHVKLKAIKTPTGAPRFRSSAGTETATFDWRDPSEDETFQQTVELFNIGPFENNSDDVTPLATQIDDLIKTMEIYGAGGTHVNITITGRSTTVGDDTYNEELASRRAWNVDDYIYDNKPATLNYATSILTKGEKGTTNDDEFRRVDVEITKEGSQNIAAHEAGHMFGLGDEYSDEEWDTGGGKGRFPGDKPTHYEEVKKELGEKAADEMISDNSDSVMAHGSTVEPGHYYPFIQALEKATNIQWTIK